MQPSSLLIYSTHPLPVYAMLRAALLAAARARPAKARLVLAGVTLLLGSGIFFLHAVRSHIPVTPLKVVGDEAFPDTSLPTTSGTTFASADLRGRSAALYLF